MMASRAVFVCLVLNGVCVAMPLAVWKELILVLSWPWPKWARSTFDVSFLREELIAQFSRSTMKWFKSKFALLQSPGPLTMMLQSPGQLNTESLSVVLVIEAEQTSSRRARCRQQLLACSLRRLITAGARWKAHPSFVWPLNLDEQPTT